MQEEEQSSKPNSVKSAAIPVTLASPEKRRGSDVVTQATPDPLVPWIT